MTHTYEGLKRMTLAQLREVAAAMSHNEVQGFTQMNKPHLLEAICKALHIDMHAHHEVKGLNKAEIKAEIKALKAKRDAAVEGKNPAQLKMIRRRIHRLKRTMHKATV